jgi:hypothetical protein
LNTATQNFPGRLLYKAYLDLNHYHKQAIGCKQSSLSQASIQLFDDRFQYQRKITVSNLSHFLVLKTSLCAKHNIHLDICQHISYSATYCHSHLSLRQISFRVLNSAVQAYFSTNSGCFRTAVPLRYPSCSLKNLTYSLLGYREKHGDERFRTRLRAHFPAVQILNPTDVRQETGQFLYSYNESQQDALFLRLI